MKRLGCGKDEKLDKISACYEGVKQVVFSLIDTGLRTDIFNTESLVVRWRNSLVSRRPKSLLNKILELLKFTRKVPMFCGLSADCTRPVLPSCELRDVRGNESICRVNAQSDEMYLLLSGQLDAHDEDQIQLTGVDPVALVDEMGLVVGQPRSATVDALEKCNLRTWRSVAFNRWMRSNDQLYLLVYRSVIETVVQRWAVSRIARKLVGQSRAILERKRAEIEHPFAVLISEGAI